MVVTGGGHEAKDTVYASIKKRASRAHLHAGPVERRTDARERRLLSSRGLEKVQGKILGTRTGLRRGVILDTSRRWKFPFGCFSFLSEIRIRVIS
jgi:hypothetical protein